MSTLTAQTMDLVKMLPDEELKTVNSLLKMLVRSWDPDFSKVTSAEKERLQDIEQAMENGEYYSEDEVWN